VSYDPTLPTDKDVVRLYLGDTTSPELLTDAQIEAVLALYPSNISAAISVLAQSLVTRFAQQPTSITLPSGLSISYAERIKAWAALAANGGAAGISTAFSVGLTRSDGYAELQAAAE